MNSVYVILTFVAGWFAAQMIKVILLLIEKKKITTKDIIDCIVKTGGMPSSHTACYLAMSLMIGFIEGFNSTLFALAICTLVIIIYDAMNVRYAVGEQGKALNKIIEKKIKVVEGHTVFQVLIGGLMGIAVAFGMKLLLNV